MVVVQSPTGGRAEVHPDSLHDWVLRGYVALGPAAEGATGLLTSQEWRDELAARAAQVAAATNPTGREAKTAQEG